MKPDWKQKFKHFYAFLYIPYGCFLLQININCLLDAEMFSLLLVRYKLMGAA